MFDFAKFSSKNNPFIKKEAIELIALRDITIPVEKDTKLCAVSFDIYQERVHLIRSNHLPSIESLYRLVIREQEFFQGEFLVKEGLKTGYVRKINPSFSKLTSSEYLSLVVGNKTDEEILSFLNFFSLRASTQIRRLSKEEKNLLGIIRVLLNDVELIVLFDQGGLLEDKARSKLFTYIEESRKTLVYFDPACVIAQSEREMELIFLDKENLLFKGNTCLL